MLTNLRSRLALFLLPGIFLVPIAISSLGDLTHVATCERAVRTPFTLNVPKEGPADVLSSLRLTRSGAKGLCGGLTVNLAARTSQAGAVEMIVPVTNHSAYLWRGTVTLRLGDTP